MPKTKQPTKKLTKDAKTAPATKKPGATAKPQKPAATKAKPPVKAVKPVEKPKQKPPFKKDVTQKLLEAKSKILQEVSQKVKTESNVLKFEIGDIYDIASNERERELTLMLGDRDRGKLAEIEDALERIRENTYGECEDCGEPIAEDRLRALPFTRVCVECQFKNEREQRIKGRFEEETGLGIMEKSDEEDEY